MFSFLRILVSFLFAQSIPSKFRIFPLPSFLPPFLCALDTIFHTGFLPGTGISWLALLISEWGTEEPTESCVPVHCWLHCLVIWPRCCNCQYFYFGLLSWSYSPEKILPGFCLEAWLPAMEAKYGKEAKESHYSI